LPRKEHYYVDIYSKPTKSTKASCEDEKDTKKPTVA